YPPLMPPPPPTPPLFPYPTLFRSLTRIVHRLARFAFDRRAVLKRFVPIRGPVLLKLSDFRMYVRLDDWAIGARIALKRRYEPHRSEEHTSELQSRGHLVCRLLLEK